MQGRMLFAALTATYSVVACSKPTTTDQQHQSAEQHTRQIQLVDIPVADPRVVSDLEAGRNTRMPRARPVARKISAASEIHQPAQITEAEPAPRMSTSVLAVAETASELAEVPFPAPATAVAEGPGAGDGDHQVFAGGSREPTVIIRGGLGSPRDDCKIHGRGARGGIAINSIAPPMRGQSIGRSMPGYVRIR